MISAHSASVNAVAGDARTVAVPNAPMSIRTARLLLAVRVAVIPVGRSRSLGWPAGGPLNAWRLALRIEVVMVLSCSGLRECYLWVTVQLPGAGLRVRADHARVEVRRRGHTDSQLLP